MAHSAVDTCQAPLLLVLSPLVCRGSCCWLCCWRPALLSYTWYSFCVGDLGDHATVKATREAVKAVLNIPFGIWGTGSDRDEPLAIPSCSIAK